MNKIRKVFNKAIAVISKRPVDSDGNIIKILYHGSSRKVDLLEARENFDSDLSKKMRGVFATPNFIYAKDFAINSCLANGMTKFKSGKFYLENIRKQPSEKFYIYSVDSAGFVLDKRNEYVRFADTKIIDVQEFDVIKEIESEGYEIFLMDEIDQNLSINEKNKIIGEYIKAGKFKRVDIPKIIRASSDNEQAKDDE